MRDKIKKYDIFVSDISLTWASTGTAVVSNILDKGLFPHGFYVMS